MTEALPSRIAGKYDVIKKLGEGGIGEVYLVKHADLGVEYALKVLNEKISADEQFIARFKNEAEILLKFSHAGSVQLRDFGRTKDNHYYMAMDFCRGKVLTDIIEKQGRFKVEPALEIIIQVLSVLEAAHRIGIVHRDIKPDNIMIEDGTHQEPIVKILDFGIATLKAGLGAVSGDVVTIGTPEYMSPEQAAGEREPDHRADIYAVGVLFYELLSGSVPFRGETIVDTLLMHLIQPLEPIPAKFEIPFIVEEIVAHAMKKDLDQRYQSAKEFSDACREVLALLRGETPQTRHTQVITRRNRKDTNPEPGAQRGGRKVTKILCLDDDEMVLNIMRFILEKEGYQVFTATTFASIHAHIFEEHVDLLISDVQMPGLSGGKVCELIKQNAPHVKIVLFSNIDERELEALAKDSKADSWISKNWKPDQWVKGVKEILARN